MEMSGYWRTRRESEDEMKEEEEKELNELIKLTSLSPLEELMLQNNILRHSYFAIEWLCSLIDRFAMLEGVHPEEKQIQKMLEYTKSTSVHELLINLNEVLDNPTDEYYYRMGKITEKLNKIIDKNDDEVPYSSFHTFRSAIK